MTREQGSLSAELVLVTPALVLLMLFVVFAGRLGSAAADVRQAAAEAARTASLHASPAAADAAARDTATANLAASGVDCAATDITVDTAGLNPGGTVAVMVRCIVALDDVALTGLPGSRTLQAEAVEVVDLYRGGS